MSDKLFGDKMKMLESLTGVNSSKLNYYLEAKKHSEEVIKQNNRLEIIYQIIQDINIDMSLEDIIKRVHQKMPRAISCDSLGLALLRRDNLYMKAMLPGFACAGEPVPEYSVLWEAVREKECKVCDLRYLESNRIFNRQAIQKLQLLSLALAPLIVKGEVIGVLMVGCREAGTYGSDEINFINQLAGQLAICIENARLYEEVLRGKKEWEETFKAVTDPILLIDLNYNILRCNKRFEALPAGVRKNVGEKKCYQVLWDRETRCEQCLMDEVCGTGGATYRRFQVSTGCVYDVFYYPVFNEKDEIYAIIHHLKDVTEQVKIEAQLMQSAKLAAIGEMAAGVAHELNSPMTAILGNAQMLRRDMQDDNPPVEFVDDIINCGLRCKKIIQNLLTFSRQDERPMASINLNGVVERVLGLIKYQVHRNNAVIETVLEDRLPEVQANGQQLDQVLVNLLLNARDALEKKEGHKNIKVITGRCEREGQEAVHVTVIDNGEGIAPEHMEKIFNPFYTTKEHNKGTGLGLSVSLGIAEAHGGTIKVESEPGRGSKFSFIIPVKK